MISDCLINEACAVFRLSSDKASLQTIALAPEYIKSQQCGLYVNIQGRFRLSKLADLSEVA